MGVDAPQENRIVQQLLRLWHPITLVFGLSIGLNLLLWGLALFVFPRGEAAAILHYSSDVGIDFVGEGRHISVLPLVGSVILVLNGVVGAAIWRADARVAWLTWSSMPLVQGFLLAGFYFLWRINS